LEYFKLPLKIERVGVKLIADSLAVQWATGDLLPDIQKVVVESVISITESSTICHVPVVKSCTLCHVLGFETGSILRKTKQAASDTVQT
jgi:hypothetical protein